MITGFIGRVTAAGELKDARDIGSRRVRAIAVHVTDEMVDMMDARRVYEANASIFQTAKGMLKQALSITVEDPGGMKANAPVGAQSGSSAIAALHNLANRLDEELEATTLRGSWRNGERKATL